MREDPQLPAVFTREIAVGAGLTRNQIEQRLANGCWRRLVRGAFCLTDGWEQAVPEERHLLLARAVLLTRRQSAPAVLSHVTAGVLHRLPLSAAALGTVWTTASAGYERSTRYGHVHKREVAALPAGDVREIRGLPATTVARTVADCLRHLPLAEAVPMADVALHEGLLTVAQLRAIVDRQASWPYSQAARTALDLVDGRRESVFESRSAVVMHQYRLPRPTPQLRIYDERGLFVARPDFVWLERGVVGEADGAAKYDLLTPVQAFRAEKDRQAALEALGLVVVRWEWRHLFGDPPELVSRLRRALAAGNPAGFRGRVA